MRIYLAIPYSWNHEKSFEVANKVAAKLIEEGHVVYSPISMSHPIQPHLSLPNSFETWMRQDLEFIDWCDEVHMVEIGPYGGELIAKSRGCQAEYEHAQSINKPIKLIPYNE